MSTIATKRGPYKRGPKSTETGPVVGVHEEPITINRPNIPNRYDREALRDFFAGPNLERAYAHFDQNPEIAYPFRFALVLFNMLLEGAVK